MKKSPEKYLRSKARNAVRREVKRAEAETRQAERDNRSPREQLNLLDRKLGKDKGARKERDRLQKMIGN